MTNRWTNINSLLNSPTSLPSLILIIKREKSRHRHKDHHMVLWIALISEFHCMVVFYLSVLCEAIYCRIGENRGSCLAPSWRNYIAKEKKRGARHIFVPPTREESIVKRLRIENYITAWWCWIHSSTHFWFITESSNQRNFVYDRRILS